MNSIQTSVNDLLSRQPKEWKLFKDNLDALNGVQTKRYQIGQFEIVAQFNPARVISTAAKVDKASIQKRKCFLCPEHLPAEQLRLPVLDGYQILCNPYPIFPNHLTIPTVQHTPQSISPRIRALLELSSALPLYTLFYNGPQCGASAPDHAHFQAAPFGLMPMDREVRSFCSPLYQQEETFLYKLCGYLRNGFVLTSTSIDKLARLFHSLYMCLPQKEGETEPMMNLFTHFEAGEYRLIVIPRKSHRPWQYQLEAGKEQFLSSPGAADIGGLFVTVRAEDFNRLSSALLEDIYQQVCWGDSDINRMAACFLEKGCDLLENSSQCS